MVLGKPGQGPTDRLRALGIEVHQHVVHDQGKHAAPPREVSRQAEPDAEVELLGGAAAQRLGTAYPTARVDD